MPTTLTAKFDTRRDAEMTIERLVQEHGIDRAKIQITTEDAANSAGSDTAGSDVAGKAPSPETRDDAALEGRIVVSAEIDDARMADVKAAFAEFDAAAIAEQ